MNQVALRRIAALVVATLLAMSGAVAISASIADEAQAAPGCCVTITDG